MKLTYTIQVAIPSSADYPAAEMTAALQQGYDRDPVGGWFSITKVGSSTAIVTFTRHLDEDSAACKVPPIELTPALAMEQLAADLIEAWEGHPIAAEHMVNRLVDALKHHDGTVEGLLVQRPRLRLVLDLVYPSVEARDRANDGVNELLLQQLGNDYFPGSLTVDTYIVRDFTAANPHREPTRIALDLTGGNIQWAVADRPVEFMVLDDDLDRDCPGEAEPIMVNITDVDGVQTLAHKPGPMDLDPELVEHFFKQAR